MQIRVVSAGAALLAVGALPSSLFAQVASFPGALGYGATATGGRTGTVYHVTNLNDSGAGSFRDAVSASNRIIVFDVGGYVHIASPVTAQSNLTILGQTAPGDGFGVYGAEVSFYGRTNDIVRYVHFRDTTLDPGGTGTGNSSGNCINLGNTSNMILDHVSCEYASYNNIDAAGTTGANSLTIQNSLIADPIKSQQFCLHWEGDQGTFINNAFANYHGRSPLAKGNTQFVNNTCYDYQYAYTTGNSGGAFNFDILNNYFIAGPSTSSAGDDFYQVDTNQTAYAAGNLLDSNKDGTLNGSSDNSTGATVSGTILLSGTAQLPLLTPAASYAYNIAQSGDSLKHDPSTYAPSIGYDPADAQTLNEIKSLGASGALYNTETSNGGVGIGTLNGGSLGATNYSTLKDPLGYTMVEHWANQMADSTRNNRIWSAANGNWVTNSGSWSAASPIIYDLANVQGNGAGADGSVTVSSGAASAFQLFIGGSGGAAGETVLVSGGSLTVLDTITVGNNNNGNLIINGGLVDATNVILGNTTASSTTYNGAVALNGGTLQVNQLVLGGGTPGAWTTGGSVSFNGGALQAGGTFTMNAPGTISLANGTFDTNGNAGTISGVLSGPGALIKVGAGTLNLTASNSFAGGVTLNAGELGISSNNNIAGANATINFNGGILQIQGTSLTSLGTHPVNYSTFNGGFDIVSSSNTFTVSQTLGGAGSFTKNGAGALVLSGSNAYGGGTTINGGTLIVSTDANLGANGSTFSVNGGALRITGTTLTSTINHPLYGNFAGTIDVNTAANTFTVNQQVNGTGDLTKTGAGTLVLGTRDYLSGNLFLNAGAVRIADPLSLRYMSVNLNTAGTTLDLGTVNNATIGSLIGTQGLDLKGFNIYVGNDNSNFEYDGVFSSSIAGGGITKIGTGTMTVTASSTYTGPTNISGGILSISTAAIGGVPSTLGASSNAKGNLVLNGGALQYVGASGNSTDRLFDLTTAGGTLDASGAGDITFNNTGVLIPSAAGNTTLTLTGTNTGHNDIYAAIGDPAGGFTTSIVKTGTGKMGFSGSALRTYTGSTHIEAGTFETYASNNILPFATDVIIDSGGTFDLRSSSQTIDSLTGAGAVADSFAVTGNTLTVGANNGSGTFTGTLGSGTLNLAKTGTGIEVLTGTDGYIGTTTINGGVLQFNQAAAIGSTGATVTATSPGGAAAGYAMDQAFLGRMTATSNGFVALGVSDANNLSFSGLPSLSFGAVAASTFSGTLTPASSTYLFGGGGSTLTISSAALTGARSVTVGMGTTTTLSTLTLNMSAAQSYTGATTLRAGGTLRGALANGGSASALGASTNAAANLVLDGGILAASGATDRLFTLTANGGTIDNSAGLSFTNSGNAIVNNGVSATLNLIGTSTAHNAMSPALADPTGGTLAVTENGSGKWTFNVPGNKTYSGDTHVVQGTLEALNTNAFSANSNMVLDSAGVLDFHDNSGQVVGALMGSGNVVNSFAGTHTDTFTIGANNASGTFNGNINSAGTFNLTKSGTGTQVLAGTESFTGNVTAANGVLTINGTLANTPVVMVNYPATFNANTSQTLASLASDGTANFNAASNSIGSVDGAGSLNVNASVQLTTSHVRQGALSIAAGAKVMIASNGTPTGTSSVTTLALNPAGTLDLVNNGIAVTDTTQFAAVKSAIIAASDGGLWDKPGLTSSQAAVNSSDHSIGCALASALGSSSFNGITFSDAVIARYTLIGDSSLKGTVDLSDYTKVVLNLGMSNANWSDGNFDYSGNVNLGDYTAVIRNLGRSDGQSSVLNATGPTAAQVKASALTLHAAPTVAQASTATDVTLLVNPTNGRVTLVNALQTGQAVLTAYTINSPSQSLLPFSADGGGKYLANALENNPSVFYKASNGLTYNLWTGIKNVSTFIGEGFSNHYNANVDSTWTNYTLATSGYALGTLFKRLSSGGTRDLVFQWEDANLNTYTSVVTYVGAVPEPGSVSLIAAGALTLLGRRRRSRPAK